MQLKSGSGDDVAGAQFCNPLDVVAERAQDLVCVLAQARGSGQRLGIGPDVHKALRLAHDTELTTRNFGDHPVRPDLGITQELGGRVHGSAGEAARFRFLFVEQTLLARIERFLSEILVGVPL